jgi:hypothetical protein
MEASAGVFDALVESPFPGLRAFEVDESLLFFGRETHTEELLRRLSESRFLAVVGTSGCGKSSLVRAGLLPALFRGYLVRATSRWRFAILRPGKAPIDALAAALAKGSGLEGHDAASIRAALVSNSGGLVEVVRQAGFAPGENLLVVVDQFEEIFRFAPEGPLRDGEESQAALFVSLLLHAVDSNAPIYVTLTMRSDYQGDCAQFPGLPEALNRSQYLVPRLTRDERREVIVRPLELVGAAASPRLVNRLLNDAGDDPDHLPVLQHALLQTYRHWREAGGHGSVDLPDYEAVGGITNALGRHAEEVLAGFTADDQGLAEKIFRCLAVTERGRVVRRPQELGALHAIASAGDDLARGRVSAIVSTFARREHSLLILSSPVLEAGTVVDITHESLMRKWPRLADWIKEEGRSADWYGDLARDVVRCRAGSGGLWRDPELSEVLRRRDREGWNAAWARQYSGPDGPPFDETERFLDASVEAQAEELSRAEAQWRKDLEQARSLARARRRTSISLALLLVTIVLAGAMVYFFKRRTEHTVAQLTGQYLSVQKAAGASAQRTIELQAQVDAARRQLRLSTADPAEKSRLREELTVLQRVLSDSQSKAGAYQVQLNDLRKNQDLATSDHSALLKRIQDLQSQLDAVTVRYDKLRSDQANAAVLEERDKLRVELTSAMKRNEVLLAQFAAAAAERDKLLSGLRDAMSSSQRIQQDALASRPAIAPRGGERPLFLVLPENSVEHLTAVPFNNLLAIGVGSVHHQKTSYIRVYIWAWTADRKELPPPRIHGDEHLAKQLLGPLDEQACNADGNAGRWCYRVQRAETIRGNPPAGRFTFGGVSYEIRATGWNSDDNPRSISLALYPAAQPASAK